MARTPPRPVMRVKNPSVGCDLCRHTAGMRKGQSQDHKHLLSSYVLAWDLGQMTFMLEDVSDGDRDVTFLLWPCEESRNGAQGPLQPHRPGAHA